jgi:hypothetical protein
VLTIPAGKGRVSIPNVDCIVKSSVLTIPAGKGRVSIPKFYSLCTQALQVRWATRPAGRSARRVCALALSSVWRGVQRKACVCTGTVLRLLLRLVLQLKQK